MRRLVCLFVSVGLFTLPITSFGQAARKPQVPKAQLKPFEFKGFVAGAPVAPEQLASCTPDEGQIECVKTDDVVAGATVGTFIDFYNGRMTRASIILLNSEHLLDIVQAFNAKYGAPCKVGTETWQNGVGAKLDNSVITWCFKTGELVVKQYGVRINVPSIVYSDEYSAPSSTPKVDF